MSESVEAGNDEGMTRRHLLKRGAQVGAVAAWTIPVVQVVSMTPAHADSTSKPRNPGHGSGSGTGSQGTEPTSGTTSTSQGSSGSGTLPFTGASVAPTVAIGAGALAVGAGLMAVTAKKKSAQADDATATE